MQETQWKALNCAISHLMYKEKELQFLTLRHKELVEDDRDDEDDVVRSDSLPLVRLFG